MKKLAAIVLATIAIVGIAAAEITYPVDVETTRWAMIDTDTGNVLYRNRTWWITADGSEPVGLTTNLVLLRETADVDPSPGVDYRVFRTIHYATPYISNNVMHTTHTIVRREKPEIKDHADNREREAYSKLLGDEVSKRDIIQTLLQGALLNKVIFDENPPAKVRALAREQVDKSILIWRNRDRIVELHDQIDADENIDLDAGWTESE